jgi:hypothetical protein
MEISKKLEEGGRKHKRLEKGEEENVKENDNTKHEEERVR